MIQTGREFLETGALPVFFWMGRSGLRDRFSLFTSLPFDQTAHFLIEYMMKKAISSFEKWWNALFYPFKNTALNNLQEAGYKYRIQFWKQNYESNHFYIFIHSFDERIQYETWKYKTRTCLSGIQRFSERFHPADHLGFRQLQNGKAHLYQCTLVNLV